GYLVTLANAALDSDLVLRRRSRVKGAEMEDLPGGGQKITVSGTKRRVLRCVCGGVCACGGEGGHDNILVRVFRVDPSFNCMALLRTQNVFLRGRQAVSSSDLEAERLGHYIH